MKRKTRKTDPSLAAKYLSQPYSRILVPQEGGKFSAEILEFPGCFAEGGSPAETYSSLERAAEDWLLACLESKKPVPEPLTDYESSGKYALRLPKSLYRRAAKAAAKEGTSLNQFIVTAVAETLGEHTAAERLEAALSKIEASLKERVSHQIHVIQFSRHETASTNPASVSPSTVSPTAATTASVFH